MSLTRWSTADQNTYDDDDDNDADDAADDDDDVNRHFIFRIALKAAPPSLIITL